MKNYKESDNRDELIQYAVELGISFNKNISLPRLKERISLELDGPVDVSKKDDDRITIVIHKTDNDTGSPLVSVGLNGRNYIIKRGEEVSVPPGVVHILRNAIKDVYAPDGKGNPIKREVMAYPFSVV